MSAVFDERATLDWLAQRMRERRLSLASVWLDRVQMDRLVTQSNVFVSHQLVDHIPEVILAIAAHLEGTSLSIAENDELIARALELGSIRHIQRATVPELLREYRVLAEVLEGFIEEEVDAIRDADGKAIVLAMRRMGEALRVLQHYTVDTFVTTYTSMIEQQTTQLRKFSRLVSHEIRQPLAVLQVIARALPERTNGQDATRIIDILERSVLRLGDVTGQLERLARISPATDFLLSERRVELTEVAHTAAAQLGDAATAQDVEIYVHPQLPVLRLDPARAELVFVHLIANAIKFSDPAKPTRYVEISPATGDEPSVLVRDNGVGMPPARLQTIFREFVRAHGQRDDDVRVCGWGLGLSIVRECMDHANGSVRVDSMEGGGTTFKLTWPLAHATAAR